MSEEIKATKRAFHEDIFADDADKWSWPGSVPNTKPSGSGVLYDTHTSEVKSESSSSVNSEEGFVFRGDSNSLKRSFRKRGSSCSSEGNQDDVSSSPHPSVGLTHERLLPSMYDDDARSGSPSSVFEKKDLAFRSSFKKSIDSSPVHSLEETPTGARAKRLPSDRDQSMDKQRSHSPKRKDSRDRSRHLSADRKARSSRSGSRSREKKYWGRSKTRSRSRSRDRRGRSPMERRRSRSRDRHPERRRRHSRNKRSPSRDSHRRSRSRSYDRHRRRGHYRSSSRDRRRRRRYSRSRSHSRDRSRGGRKPGSLPLSTSGGTMTPQMALQQTMATMNAKAQALTGVALPKYYNPAAVNPLKYAEQVQKRKLLWQSKEKVEETGPKNSVWEKMTFAQDQDGKMTAKFRKLMGMKVPENSAVEGEDKEEALKKQEELFRDLDQQYEMARMTTHTQRGVGLGYSSQTLFPVQK